VGSKLLKLGTPWAVSASRQSIESDSTDRRLRYKRTTVPWAVENLSTGCFRRPRGPAYRCRVVARCALPVKPESSPPRSRRHSAKMSKSLLSKLDTDCGIKKGLGFRGRGLGNCRLLVVSFQVSVWRNCARTLVSTSVHPFILHSSPFCLLPSPRSLLNQSNCSAPQT
jgi:hypothetical protein